MKTENGNLTKQAKQTFGAPNPDEIRYLFFSQKDVDHKIKLAEERGSNADKDYYDAYRGRQSRADVRVNVASVSDLAGTREITYTQNSASFDDRYAGDDAVLVWTGPASAMKHLRSDPAINHAARPPASKVSTTLKLGK